MPEPDRRLAAVFDFDGVLADTERLHLRAFQHALGDVGWTLDEREYFDRYLGYSDRDLIAALARDRKLACAPADLDRLVARKGEIFAADFAAGEALFPGAASCIARLGAVFPIGIASGALRSEIDLVLGAADLLSAFGAIVSADDVAQGKPAPDVYIEAAARLGVEPSVCVAIEDSPWGLTSAATAGMVTIAVTTSYPAAALTAATHIVSSLESVTEDLVRRLVATHPPTNQPRLTRTK